MSDFFCKSCGNDHRFTKDLDQKDYFCGACGADTFILGGLDLGVPFFDDGPTVGPSTATLTVTPGSGQVTLSWTASGADEDFPLVRVNGVKWNTVGAGPQTSPVVVSGLTAGDRVDAYLLSWVAAESHYLESNLAAGAIVT